MIRILMKIYAWFRGLFDRKRPIKDSSIEEMIQKLDMDGYSRLISDMPYKSDKLRGLIDRTDTIEHFFDLKATSDRDCDDFARAWSYWGNYHGYNAYEYIVLNPKRPFKTAHVITILEKEDEIVLCNYRPYKGNFKTKEEAVEYMRKLWPSSYVDKFRYVLYKEFEAA